MLIELEIEGTVVYSRVLQWGGESLEKKIMRIKHEFRLHKEENYKIFITRHSVGFHKAMGDLKYSDGEDRILYLKTQGVMNVDISRTMGISGAVIDKAVQKLRKQGKLPINSRCKAKIFQENN